MLKSPGNYTAAPTRSGLRLGISFGSSDCTRVRNSWDGSSARTRAHSAIPRNPRAEKRPRGHEGVPPEVRIGFENPVEYSGTRCTSVIRRAASDPSAAQTRTNDGFTGGTARSAHRKRMMGLKSARVVFSHCRLLVL